VRACTDGLVAASKLSPLSCPAAPVEFHFYPIHPATCLLARPPPHTPPPTVDAINSSHSAELSAGAAATAHSQLSAYFQRFQPRLAPGNCRHIQTLLRAAEVRPALGAAGGLCCAALRETDL
jgi:hypothetical protein